MKIIIEIPIEKITSNQYQPRLKFNSDSLMDLAQSIRENGLIQPIAVREIKDKEGYYEIIAGERRYKACMLAGYHEVSAIVMNANDIQMAEMALVENIQRENLSSIEEAKAFVMIMRQSHLTQEEMATKMGKSQSTVANKVRLLNLPEPIQEAVSKKILTERHARALLSVEGSQQMDVFRKILAKGYTVRETEKYIEREINNKVEDKIKKPIFRGFTRNTKVAANTIYQAVEMIKKMGIDVITQETETETEAQIIIKFKK